MISTESKFYSSKNSIYESLQVRTNKHRCFVFCIGHTSLTCVPGIGQKNKYLLNQSGIYDLTTLYSKYHSINNIANFKQWLEYDIGFTSYQAKMTTCGLSSKLGKIKELNTGLIPICCSTKERRKEKYRLLFNNKNINKRNQNIKLINGKNKKLKIKPENLLTNSSYDDQIVYLTEKEKELSSMDIDLLTTYKYSIENKVPIKIIDDQIKTHSSSSFVLNEKTTKLHSTTGKIFTLTKQKLQATLDNSQDKLVSTSKISPNSSIGNDSPRKSILRSIQSKSIPQFHTNLLLASIKQQQEQIQNKSFQIIESPTTDSSKKSKSNEISSNKIDNKSISAIKRSYALLPISTPAIFPIKPKSLKKFDSSDSIPLSSENNLTPKMDHPMLSNTKFNSNNPPSKDEELTSNRIINDVNTQNKTITSFPDKLSQEDIFNQFDSSSNKSQQNKIEEVIEKIVCQIIKQAFQIVNEVIQPSQINTISLTKVDLIEYSSIQTPIFHMKNSNDKVQSIILSLRQDDQHRTISSKCIPLAERLAQAKAKKLATIIESNSKDDRSLQLLEQDSSVRKKCFSLTNDRLKQSFTNTSSLSPINQFKNKKKSYENSTSTHAQQESNNIFFIDKMTNTSISSANTGS
ncbi:unnamed protein product [Rotaria sp. Silwood2]|nr:unnamed protein product [Rotaria sp. Silwood2]CAF3982931.1 unnamed protein product [Rotaria sp. Silwood2]